MKHLYKIWLCISLVGLITSCADDEPLAFDVEKPESIIVQDEINDYASLKSYVDKTIHPAFKLGAGASLSEFNDKGVMHRLVKNNFDEITLGYGMKHGAVVQSDGSLSLDGVEVLIQNAKDAGITVFGHTLCWHSNQNAGYLNNLIAPMIVSPPTIVNSLDLSGLKDATFTDWGISNSGNGITIEDGEGMGGTGNAVVLKSSSVSSNPEDLQLVAPTIDVVDGHSYEIIFYIKSDVPGEGRVSFEGLKNNTPSIDWMDSGAAKETFATSISWQEVRFQVTDFDADNFVFKLDLGYQPGVNYYVDINNFYIYDTQGDKIIENLIPNGDFEEGHIDNWGGWGGSSTRTLSAEGEGYGNTGYCFVVNNPIAGNFWEVQSVYTLGEGLEVGEEYLLSFMVKADNDARIIPEMQSASWEDGADGFGNVYLSDSWTKVELTVTPTIEGRLRLIISYGEMGGTVWLDNFVLRKASGGSSALEETVVEKTSEEKGAIIDMALEDWMSTILSVTKDYVTSWDVVNEPMDDGNPYELKTSDGDDSSDEFFWQDYLGKDYAVRAIQLAREYGNPNDLLFLNDYNLEYNIDKCKGLIQYVEYIESKGVKVDGIGTQMHISTTSDKDKIVTMFELLAETGKLIKISELDIGIGGKTTSDATDEDYILQAEMYQFVVEKYLELIPVVQQYGITAWSPLDSPENNSWRANQPIGLWKLDYSRKRAYSAFAEGLSSN